MALLDFDRPDNIVDPGPVDDFLGDREAELDRSLSQREDRPIYEAIFIY
ncbi:MAG TPA: hypothetical protein VIJ60_05755 [Acidimicrobiales bacterium]